jgi:hypothetical protein
MAQLNDYLGFFDKVQAAAQRRGVRGFAELFAHEGKDSGEEVQTSRSPRS